MLLRALEVSYLPYEPNDHQLPVAEDSDSDLLTNKEETAIGYQKDRLTFRPPLDGSSGDQPPQPPPPSYALVNVSRLLGEAGTYNGTLIEVLNCTFDRWINPSTFLFYDTSSIALIRIELIGYTPPSLSSGSVFHVKGTFVWFDGNIDGIVQPPEVAITVRIATYDFLILA